MRIKSQQYIDDITVEAYFIVCLEGELRGKNRRNDGWFQLQTSESSALGRR